MFTHVHTLPPPFPFFCPEGIFEGRGEGVDFEPPPRKEFFRSSSFFSHPIPRGVFSGVGVCFLFKFGPPAPQASASPVEHMRFLRFRREWSLYTSVLQFDT